MTLSSLFKTVQRDFRLVEGHTKALIQLKWLDMKGVTVGKVFDQHAKKNPERICFYFDNQEWTFKQVEDISNKIGNYFSKEGFNSQDVISLFMENRPEYVCTWLGLSKIGVVTSLINYNLRSTPLKHSLEVAKTKAIVCGTELSPALLESYSELKLAYPIYLYGEESQSQHMTTKNANVKIKSLDFELKNVSTATPTSQSSNNFRSPLFYCYTSGTTGYPKAAVITNSRFFMAAYVNHYASELTMEDRIYMTLPLYHVAGGMLGLSQTLVWGTPLIIRTKFSASAFFKECALYKATAAQYIAETCRFLLQAPKSEFDTKHKVRVLFGNGFRRDIWDDIVNRFNIPKVTEFYASTEGNANMVNYDNTPGAVGVVPPWLEKVYPIALVKVDEDSGDLIRDPKTGFLVRCKPGEAGELLGKIVTNSPLRDFKGYAADKEANEKKTVRNVFNKGDAYFRTGDLLYKDEQGYHYFRDRMGDTFRWRSENVSAAEVEAVLSSSSDLRDVVAFGVKIPNYDGTAGMAVIADPSGSLDMKELEGKVVKTLPPYARPVFIRITKEIPMTGTHKLKKTELAKEAYDLTKSDDKIYILLSDGYVPFTKALERRVNAKDIKL